MCASELICYKFDDQSYSEDELEDDDSDFLRSKVSECTDCSGSPKFFSWMVKSLLMVAVLCANMQAVKTPPIIKQSRIIKQKPS